MTPIGQAARLDGLSVLLVERDADNRDMIARALRGRGAAVRSARDAKQAMAILSTAGAPDLLVIAAILPEEDGISFMRRIRRVDNLRRVPAIALSADDGPDLAKSVRDAGYQLHLTMPVSVEAVVRAISDLILRQHGSTLPAMDCREALATVHAAAKARDYSVSDAALVRVHAAGHAAGDILHALIGATHCEEHDAPQRFRLTGPSLGGTEISLLVTVDQGRVVVV